MNDRDLQKRMMANWKYLINKVENSLLSSNPVDDSLTPDPVVKPDPVADAARVLIEWWNNDEVGDARLISAISDGIRNNAGEPWLQFDAALRAITEASK